MTEHDNNARGAANYPAWQFRRMQGAHRAAVDAVLQRRGLKEYAQPFILFALLQYGDGGSMATQRELAEHMCVSPATLTASLKLLERQGCVVRVADETDLRCKRIAITERGREVSERFFDAYREVDAAMYSGFTEPELNAVSGYFERISSNLRAYAKGGGADD